MNAPEQVQEGLDPQFPHDLRRWLDEDRLLRWVLDAASDLAAAGTARKFRHGSEQFGLGQMLATVSFAYLTGRYGSEEIADELEADPALRYLCLGSFPDPAAIRRFRRWHRGPLGVVLLRVLRACLAERRGETDSAAPDRDGPPRVEARRHNFELLSRCAAEAEARLARAVFADTVALDV